VTAFCLVFFMHWIGIAMRYEDEQDPKKPQPVRSTKKKGHATPVESGDDGHDRHRHI
jgi:hypothetical protein